MGTEESDEPQPIVGDASSGAARAEADAPGVCHSCGSPRSGEYCSNCGERRHDPGRESVPQLISDILGGLLNLEGRWPRALLSLLLRPGALALEWSRGKRNGWPKPTSIFVLANVVYFFGTAQFNISVLRTPLYGHLTSSPWSAWIRERVASLERWDAATAAAIAAGEWSAVPPEFWQISAQFDAHASQVSKVMVGLLIPMFAGLLSIAHRGRGRQTMDEWVLSAHFIAWWLLVVVLGAWTFIRWVTEAAYGAFPSIAALPGDVVSVPLLLGLGTWWLGSAEKRVCPDRPWALRWLTALLLSLGFMALAVYPFRWLEFELAWLSLEPN